MSLDKYATTTERKIINRLIDDALAAGYAISVNDGEETTVKQSQDRAAIRGAMATTDTDILTFWDPKGGPTVGVSKRLGFVWLIYGNDCDVISDYSANEAMDTLLAGASALAESLG
jgi:hypothetical protein